MAVSCVTTCSHPVPHACLPQGHPCYNASKDLVVPAYKPPHMWRTSPYVGHAPKKDILAFFRCGDSAPAVYQMQLLLLLVAVCLLAPMDGASGQRCTLLANQSQLLKQPVQQSVS